MKVASFLALIMLAAIMGFLLFSDPGIDDKATKHDYEMVHLGLRLTECSLLKENQWPVSIDPNTTDEEELLVISRCRP